MYNFKKEAYFRKNQTDVTPVGTYLIYPNRHSGDSKWTCILFLVTYEQENKYYCANSAMICSLGILYSFRIDVSKELNILSLPTGSIANQSTVITEILLKINGNETTGTF